MSVYSTLLDNALLASKIIPKSGWAFLVMFEDKDHFDSWVRLVPGSKDSKIINLPAQFLCTPGLIQLDSNYTPDDVCITGIAFGKERDFSDVRLIYHRILAASTLKE